MPTVTVASGFIPIHRALLSVSDKGGLIELARFLDGRGVELVSTGGTARALREAGLTVLTVEDLTGAAEMMGGRVKTLHPAVHGAVLARRDVEEDRRALAERGITPIDLVCVNLYPFEETASRPGVTPSEAIEQIDIGGPAMVRSAAKNHAYVTIVTSPGQYGSLIAELEAHDGATTPAFRRTLAAAAFRLTAQYDGRISAWMDADSPPVHRELRYGENPHQAAWMYVYADPDGTSIADARILHGKELSYNNIQDAVAALELVGDLNAVSPERASAAIIKHTNACGAAAAPDLATAFGLAWDSDPLAAYGGILAVSREVDTLTATGICQEQRFFEVIVAPGYADAALSMLRQRWKNVRLLEVGKLDASVSQPSSRGPATESRSIAGGMLIQERDRALARPDDWKHVAGPAPIAAVLEDAVFAWTVVKHLRSNAVALAAGGQLLGGGCGLVDRLSACRLAIEKAGARIRDRAPTVAASDAFFPFGDGPRLLAEAGVACIVHPGGSKRDQETIDVCEKHGVTCLVTGVRHFRH